MKRFLVVLTVILMMAGCGKKTGDGTPATGEAAPKSDIKVPEVKWIYNIEEAVVAAGKENRAVLVNFTGSDWCSWCFRLRDEVFTQPEFAKYADESLVLVELDYPQRKLQSDEMKKYNKKLLEKYGVQGFPTILIIDKDGKETGRTGYRQGGAAAYVEHLKSFIK